MQRRRLHIFDEAVNAFNMVAMYMVFAHCLKILLSHHQVLPPRLSLIQQGLMEKDKENGFTVRV